MKDSASVISLAKRFMTLPSNRHYKIARLIQASENRLADIRKKDARVTLKAGETLRPLIIARSRTKSRLYSAHSVVLASHIASHVVGDAHRPVPFTNLNDTDQRTDERRRLQTESEK